MSKYDDPKLEFDRGYNFGKEDGYQDAFKTLFGDFDMEVAQVFEDDTVVVKIPREKLIMAQQELRKKVKQTA